MKLSVVMPVYNGARRLRQTLDSIFSQSESDLELIVVNDGSTDTTAEVLATYTDPRLRVLAQSNTGITRALIRGCAEARADVIARHDCGDVSHPDRFRRQLALLSSDPAVALVSCATAFEGPEGEPLYVVHANGDEVRRSLLHDPLETIRGLTHHGSAMFRRDAYREVGGYRPELYFAQDLDLWIRMAAHSGIAFADEVLYVARIDVSAISSVNRAEQLETTRLILAMRDDPSRTAELLTRASTIRPSRRTHTRRAEARALYFIASCLRRQGNPQWRDYASRARRRNPLFLRSWALLLRDLMRER